MHILNHKSNYIKVQNFYTLFTYQKNNSNYNKITQSIKISSSLQNNKTIWQLLNQLDRQSNLHQNEHQNTSTSNHPYIPEMFSKLLYLSNTTTSNQASIVFHIKQQLTIHQRRNTYIKEINQEKSSVIRNTTKKHSELTASIQSNKQEETSTDYKIFGKQNQ